MGNQAFLFIAFIINGILIGIIFDIFRVFRRTFKTTDIITYIEDTIFWIIAGLLTLYFIFCFNNGEIRFYIFLGIFLGIVIYMLLFSKYFIKINVTIINFVKSIICKTISIILYPLKLLFKILKKIFFKPFSFVFINIRLFFTKSLSNIINKVKKLHKFPKKPLIKKDF